MICPYFESFDSSYRILVQCPQTVEQYGEDISSDQSGSYCNVYFVWTQSAEHWCKRCMLYFYTGLKLFNAVVFAEFFVTFCSRRIYLYDLYHYISKFQAYHDYFIWDWDKFFHVFFYIHWDYHYYTVSLLSVILSFRYLASALRSVLLLDRVMKFSSIETASYIPSSYPRRLVAF